MEGEGRGLTLRRRGVSVAAADGGTADAEENKEKEEATIAANEGEAEDSAGRGGSPDARSWGGRREREANEGGRGWGGGAVGERGTTRETTEERGTAVDGREDIAALVGACSLCSLSGCLSFDSTCSDECAVADAGWMMREESDWWMRGGLAEGGMTLGLVGV